MARQKLLLGPLSGGFILLAVALSGCGIGKVLTKDSTRSRERKVVETASHVSKEETAFNERGVFFSDSSRHDYRVTIFPLDSFPYSLQDGFRGRAQSIEISGSADHLEKVKFYEMDAKTRSSDSNQLFSEKSKIAERNVSKEVRKDHFTGIILIVCACLFIAGWFWWKSRLMITRE